jgi:dienelactone hydrolase
MPRDLTRRELLAALPLCAAAAPTSPAQSFLQCIDRPRVPLAPDEQFVNGRRYSRFTYAPEAAHRVPGILLKPGGARKRFPVVVALHGTGGAKEGQLPLLEQLAERGFAGIAIDGRYHGERAKDGKGSAEYSEAMLRAYRGSSRERPFLYDTVWDVLRLLDWIETRPDLDAGRIGMIGFSKGGMELYLAAAVDPRIRASVPCIGVQSFLWALENNSWQSRVGTFQAAVDGAAKDAGVAVVDGAFVKKFYDRVAPGIYGEFDGPRMTPLIAPRPLLVINGDSDPRTPLPGLRLCIEATRAAYRAADAGDQFEFLLQEKTGHRVNPESLQMAIQWLAKRLGSSTSTG